MWQGNKRSTGMIIQCTNCQKQYNIDASKLSKNMVKFRCKACNQVITVAISEADDSQVVKAGSRPEVRRQADSHSQMAAMGASKERQ